MIDVNGETPVGDPGWAPLIDVSGVSIAELRGGGNPLLDRCLDRLLKSLDDPNGVISAFGSYIADT
jgi:hypothetical protein